MATVKEFKEWLNKFPDDTIVEIGIERNGNLNFNVFELTDNNYYGEGWEFMDLRGNPHIKPTDVNFEKSFLRLGESC